MLVDGVEFSGEVNAAADNVTTLAGPHEIEGALVYLTVQDGANDPGLYLRLASSWSFMQGATVA